VFQPVCPSPPAPHQRAFPGVQDEFRKRLAGTLPETSPASSSEINRRERRSPREGLAHALTDQPALRRQLRAEVPQEGNRV